jgi:hypothetical protein
VALSAALAESLSSLSSAGHFVVKSTK